MRLSDAIRLGSLLVENPEALNLSSCALGMAIRASGISSTRFRDQELVALWERYPWAKTTHAPCPICNADLTFGSLVFHPFDYHVMGLNDPKNVTMTIEQLADFVDSIDPTPREAVSTETVQETRLVPVA